MKQPIPAFIPIRAAVLRAPGAPLKIEPLDKRPTLNVNEPAYVVAPALKPAQLRQLLL